MSKVEIYTDGGCTGNPGPGGWAFVVLTGGKIESRKGAVPQTTNNRMELTAVIQALEYLTIATATGRRPIVRLITDSEYVRLGISTWIHNWIRNGWVTSNKNSVKNRDLWTRLHELRQQFDIDWSWVKGHSGNRYNEMCDSLVQEAIRSLGPGGSGA